MTEDKPTRTLDITPKKKKEKQDQRFLAIIGLLVAIIGLLGIIVKVFGPDIALLLFHTTPTPTATTTRIIPPPPVPHLAQPPAFHADSGDTNAVSFGEPAKQGDFILVAITQFERTLSTLTDDHGDQPQKVGGIIANPAQPGQVDQDYVELYYFPDVAEGITTITATFSGFTDQGGGDTNIGIYDYAGLSTISPVEDSANGLSGKKLSNTLETDRVLTRSGDTDLCFAVGVDSGVQDNSTPNNTVTAGNGYTLLYPPQGSDEVDAGKAERFYTEATPPQQGGCLPNFKIGYPSYWAIIGVSLRP